MADDRSLGEILGDALNAAGVPVCGVAVRYVRTTEAGRINALVNDPTVRPLAGGDITLPIDLSAAVADPANVFLVGEHGGLCFCWSAPGVFELHAFILPDGRGRWAEDFLFEALMDMAEQYGAERIWCRVAPEHRHIRILALHLGFQHGGENTIDLGAGPVTYQLFVWRA